MFLGSRFWENSVIYKFIFCDWDRCESDIKIRFIYQKEQKINRFNKRRQNTRNLHEKVCCEK